MKPLMTSSLVLVVIVGSAQAAEWIQAEVVTVTPILHQEMKPVSVRHCREVEVVTQHKETLGPSIAGAIIGGLLGSQIGKGRGRTVATGVGAAAGVGIAQSMTTPTEHTVIKEKCDHAVHYESVEVERYEVVYRLNGQQFVTTMDQRPGPTIKVNLKPI